MRLCTDNSVFTTSSSGRWVIIYFRVILGFNRKNKNYLDIQINRHKLNSKINLNNLSTDTIKNIIAPLVKKLCENATKSEGNEICVIAQELGKLVLGLESKK